MDLRIITVAERPDLAPLLSRFDANWPEFMYHDPIAELHFSFVETVYAEYTLIATDAAGEPVARLISIPFQHDGGPEQLPADGWDGVIRQSAFDRLSGRTGNLVSALEITIRPEYRGHGLAPVLLDAMRANARRLGHDTLVAPVRPNGKHRFPEMAMADYITMNRADGLPDDAWLRVHVRAGGRIVKVAPTSMVIAAPLADWRTWTGLPFDRSGPVLVEHALNPVQVDVDQDHAVYVEPNVWVHHPLT